MLPKDRRIQKKEFFQALKSSTKRNSLHFTLHITGADFIGKNSKFSFSVSKKVAKNAVVRNKIRRRGYSVISKIMATIQSDHYFIFVCKKGVENQKFETTEMEITNLLSGFFI